MTRTHVLYQGQKGPVSQSIGEIVAEDEETLVVQGDYGQPPFSITKSMILLERRDGQLIDISAPGFIRNLDRRYQ
jgi:hypothetical protein